MSVLVAPSLLAADFTRLGEEIRRIERAGADWLHLDVMDGHFVPNITFGPPLVASVRKATRLFLDVHLMINRPENFLEAFAQAGADLITVHLEAADNLGALLKTIHGLGLKAGVSVKPRTPFEPILPCLAEADLVLFMTVEPGFGGQAFMPEVLDKIRAAKKMFSREKVHPWIQVDGGVTADNAKQIIQAGADVLVSGTAIFGSADPGAVIHGMKSAGETS